jgi:putative Mg2+ transporter-C (MgtC) family protein
MDLVDWTRELPALRTLGIAGALAALIGWEREMARKPAGLRTHILVGVGSALLILLGDTIVERFAADQGRALVQSDPIRVLEAVIVGISFLGAGTIIQQRGVGVEGLTTAASVLLTAAIGMSVALGRAALATMVTLAAVAAIYFLARLEHRLATAPSASSKRHGE